MQRERWSVAESQEWYAGQPWLVGCNFIPSTAVNQLEMWQAETFDLETIERELGWARGLGFNTARVFLHDLAWRQDPSGFVDRAERFLSVAHGHCIRPLFVLFDGVWNPRPRPGPQPAPRARVHNSRWVQSPGAEVLGDESQRACLEEYVRGVVGRFAADERVVGWDLFNEPDNPNPAYARHELSNKAEAAYSLLQSAFLWARAERPSQPLTAGIWRGRVSAEDVSVINKLMLTESDVISFHSYAPPEKVRERIEDLSRQERPILLTEYLSRPGNTFEALLPLLRERRVGAYNWGLVAGKTQTYFPWDSWTRQYDEEPEPWFHDLLRPDGTPYRVGEAELLRRFSRA